MLATSSTVKAAGRSNDIAALSKADGASLCATDLLGSNSAEIVPAAAEAAGLVSP